MQILAVDDEKIALEGLVSSIEKVVPDADVMGFRRGDLAIEYASKNTIDVAFLDIEMRGENGLELGNKLKEMYPNVNIIFTTGYGEYAGEAFKMHASGYVMKPATPEKIKKELDELRHPIENGSSNRVSCKTFGNFEVFVDNKPVEFQYNKSRELFAFLVDRNGALSTIQEIIMNLWDDSEPDSHISYLKNVRKDMISTFEKLECSDVIVRQHGRIGIVPNLIDCDYFAFLNKDESVQVNYMGEYMTQYSWAEYTNGALEEMMSKR
ncbi:MAG: response regulator [Lachnospiraceae bacterium]|nr:response regulator [Lachnospiraceae bacterium]